MRLLDREKNDTARCELWIKIFETYSALFFDLLVATVIGRLSRAIAFIIWDKAVVFAVHQWRGNHKVGGRAVAGNRDVPYRRHPQERFDIRVVRHRLERVPEKDQEVDLVIDDHCADLLVAAQRDRSAVS